MNLLLWRDKTIDIDTIYFWMPLVSIILSVAFVMPKIKNGKIEIKLLYFILLGLLYFNAPLYFLALLNKQELLFNLLQLNISETNFIKANFLLGISLPLIIAGYLSSYKIGYKVNHEINTLRLSPIRRNPFLILFMIFFVLSLSVTGLAVGSTFIGISSYYYILLFRSTMIICALTLFNELIYTNSLRYVNFKAIIKRNFLIFSCIFLFIVYVLIGGDRGPALVIILMLVFGYLLIQNMRINFTTLFFSLGLFFILSTLFTFIEVLRKNDVETLSISSIEQSLETYEDYEKIPGYTLKLTALAIEGIENEIYPHSYGLFFGQSLVKGIPFFGPLIIKNVLGENFFQGTADLLTIQHSGIGYETGLGTSYLADTYIEFGLIGIIIISFFYGILIKKFDAICQSKSFTNFSEFLLISVFLGYSVYTGRATLSEFLVNFIHTWIWYIIIRHFVTLFGYKFNRKLQ